MSDTIKLTEYSHGAGCGCKIAPGVLDRILQSNLALPDDERLLVGNSSKDDAAVYDLGNGTGVISTTDFFMPIVDDPFDFGRIAATNAISDVYAMGGNPLMAIAILGWPINQLDAEIAAQVVEGGRQACLDAGILLAGGHSIDAPEPIFGLAVTGQVSLDRLKQNNTATAGSRLYLTKPLGVGILTTAQKKKLLQPEHAHIARDSMCTLNRIGAELSALPGISAMTDVTGFGLLGHLLELCEGSNLDARIQMAQVPVIAEAERYRLQGCVPGGTLRNYQSYGHKAPPLDESMQQILCDPQTSGGLLVAVEPQEEAAFLAVAEAHGLSLSCFGELLPARGGVRVEVVAG
ncbi:selenide, water dikinase SelD [Aestuariirhabdus litorea]|uniref:Selenide, water dikinase n=1 Tax=Aestuariirhabdus litorea TaxID=2528527 RepID=A0A3P3VNL4_9GAMM|nr:selenide, water dikinase SelD [Aestuariirhabdus litorea]RRJ84295.1 selenide, water dikinase SelD [Aestuariirhabdus litorea]RWW97518.1 selenide, water dikinase SelD [Endozoicomonadaceae bacterium GTF-13]